MTKPLEIKNNKITKSFKNIIPLTFGEEVGNAVSHGVAAFVTLCALPYAALQSYFVHGVLGSFSVSIYVISIFLMFLSSTVYYT
ncbi:hemolysin III family protein, partial [Mesorhizobium sp. M8A.F.Ca.ET.173.01.1.1]